ncbi:MAG: DUF2095 family protein [Thermosphaera sp.]
MSYELDEFRRKFPNLYREIVKGEGKSLSVKFDQSSLDPWRGYVPSIVDYIRRCKTIEEAFEVVDYMVRRGEVSESEARELKKILEEKGLDFFGERKGDDYYYREAVKHWESLRKTAEKRAR